jgi:hypothetical protein
VRAARRARGASRAISRPARAPSSRRPLIAPALCLASRCACLPSRPAAALSWKKFNNDEANAIGNYNVLLQGCPAHLYNAKETTWEQSHEAFHDAFAAFPWEVLEVFSGPPVIAFTWRHWGDFTGTYDGHRGSGERVEMYGFGTAEVNDKLQLVDVDIFYKAETFMEVLKGMRPASDLTNRRDVLGPVAAGGCPFMDSLPK